MVKGGGEGMGSNMLAGERGQICWQESGGKASTRAIVSSLHT